jgi:RsiW-degrading membrane proteinase PrsW (M82 family)
MHLAGSTTALPAEGVLKDITIVLIALVPSAIWITFFYLQDRAEPEPTSYVVVAFFVGMAIASLLFNPIVNSLFVVRDWIYQSLWTLLWGSLFVTGALSSFLFYMAIRYGFYLTKEFDEPADGMAYGAFIGTGFALVLTVEHLVRHPDFTLFAMAYSSSSNALVYASIGALVGYYVGRSKFGQGDHQINSLTGIATGMILFGLYQVANEYILLTGVGNVFWVSFLLTLVFSVAILVFVYRKMRRLTAKTFQQTSPPKMRADPYVFVLFAVFMMIGGYTKYHAPQDVTFTSEKYGVTFEYPRALSSPASSTIALVSPNLKPSGELLFAGVAQGEREFSLSVEATGVSRDTARMDLTQYVGNVQPINLYVQQVVIAGKKATRLKYGLQDAGSIETEGFPTITWVYTDIIPSSQHTFVLTFKAKPENFEKGKPVYSRILNSMHFSE